MKITKTVGQCPFCDVDTHINAGEVHLVEDKTSPVVSIYRRIIKDDGSVETLNDFEIFADGTVNVAPWALLDYNKKVENKPDITYLQVVGNVSALCILYGNVMGMDNSIFPDNIRKLLLAELDIIKDRPIQHNIVQIGEDEEISTALSLTFDESDHTLILQKSECNDNFCKIEDDDRFVFSKVTIGSENGCPDGFILNDGGIIFDSNKSLDCFTFSAIVDKATLIGRGFMKIYIHNVKDHNTFNEHIGDIINYESRKEQ